MHLRLILLFALFFQVGVTLAYVHTGTPPSTVCAAVQAVTATEAVLTPTFKAQPTPYRGSAVVTVPPAASYCLSLFAWQRERLRS